MSDVQRPDLDALERALATYRTIIDTDYQTQAEADAMTRQAVTLLRELKDRLPDLLTYVRHLEALVDRLSADLMATEALLETGVHPLLASTYDAHGVLIEAHVVQDAAANAPQASPARFADDLAPGHPDASHAPADDAAARLEKALAECWKAAMRLDEDNSVCERQIEQLVRRAVPAERLRVLLWEAGVTDDESDGVTDGN